MASDVCEPSVSVSLSMDKKTVAKEPVGRTKSNTKVCSSVQCQFSSVTIMRVARLAVRMPSCSSPLISPAYSGRESMAVSRASAASVGSLLFGSVLPHRGAVG